MGYRGSERSARRAVAEVKQAWHAGRRRRYRPWIPEPGMWLQWDWGDGPRIGGRKTQLFAAWLAWSRFRVVIPVWDQQMGTLTWCIDQALRAVGGAPTYLLTDNARTVTMDHVAGIPVRHPEMVALGRHYGCKVETCVPFDPESKGGVEATVKIAKADLVPSDANLLPAYGSFTELEEACREFCERVNGRVHRRSPRSRRAGWPPSGRCCTRCRTSLMRWRSARSGWSGTTRRSGSGRSAIDPARPRGDQGVVPGRRGGTGDHRPDRARRGRDRPAPSVGPGQPVHLRRALPGPPGRERAAPAQAAAADRSRGRVPGDR